MKGVTKICFVCQSEVKDKNWKLNQEVNLLICENCEGSEQEKERVKELLESLADGFVCGCI